MKTTDRNPRARWRLARQVQGPAWADPAAGTPSCSREPGPGGGQDPGGGAQAAPRAGKPSTRKEP